MLSEKKILVYYLFFKDFSYQIQLYLKMKVITIKNNFKSIL